MAATGPFYDFSAAQWQAVKETHRRFCEPEGLGRPLFLASNLLGNLWHSQRVLFPDTPVRLAGPRKRDAEMDAALGFWVRSAEALAHSPIPSDSFPVVWIHRKFYGHSQRLAEPFGTETLSGDGEAQARPCIHDMARVRRLRLKPVSRCPWLTRSLEVLRYFHDSTEGRYFIPHMVTTGPCDTVNYALGSTLFLESFYTHPRELHQLLQMATEIIIDHIRACRRIAPGRLISDHTYLLDGAYCLCSEIRSQFSAEHYLEFEAPYLKQIAAAIGPLHIHVSGPIEQSLPATLAEPHIRHLKFWLKDCDLKTVARLVGNRVSMDFFHNTCMPALAFPDSAAYFRHLMENTRPETRWVLNPYELEPWNRAYNALARAGRLPAQVRRFGRLAVIGKRS